MHQLLTTERLNTMADDEKRELEIDAFIVQLCIDGVSPHNAARILYHRFGETADQFSKRVDRLKPVFNKLAQTMKFHSLPHTSTTLH